MEYSGYTLWFTGMRGAGKRTLARYVSKRFSLLGRRWELLEDSDLEAWLPEPADAPREIRDRNTRVLGWMAQLLTRQGVITLVATPSPHRDVRDEQRKRIGRFAEVFVDCPFETLLSRDEEGVYRKAMAGELQNVVGVQAPYEPPLQPEVRVDTEKGTLEELSSQIFQRLYEQGFVNRLERDVLLGLAPPFAIAAGAVLQETAAGPKTKQAPGKRARAKPAAKVAAAAAAKPAAKEAPKVAAKAAAKKPAAKEAPKVATKAAARKPAAKTPPRVEAKPAARKAAAKTTVEKPAPKAAAQAQEKTAAAKQATPKRQAKPAAAPKRGARSGASRATSPG